MRAIVLALLAASLFAAPPTVTNVVAVSIDSTSAQVYGDVSVSGQYSHIEYGTSTGSYTNRTKDRLNLQADGATLATYARMSLGGLTPGTVYYARLTARPNSGNFTDIGYSSEFTITTSSEPSPNPTFPTQPTEWIPTAPDISGYDVVLMKRCSSGFPCADGAVAALGIANEATLQTVINAATYTNGTVIRFPRGLDVDVETVSGDGNRGYELQAKAVQSGKTIDDPTHNWIVLEGEGCSNTSYFPKYGARIDSTFSSVLPKFRATALAALNRGQHFQVDNAAAHHYLFRCLTMEYPAGEAVTTVNPNAYRHAFFISQSSTPIANQKYFVFDRIYIPGLSGTKRLYAAMYLGGSYSAVIGSHIEAGIWRPYAFPTTTPTVGGSGTRTLTVPVSTTYQLRSTDPVRGMSSGGSAVVTSAGVSGRFFLTIGQTEGKFYYDTRSVSSVVCTNCTAIGAASDPTTLTFPADEYRFVVGSVSSAGALSIDYIANNRYDNTPRCATGTETYCEMSFGIEPGYYNTGPFTVHNSYILTAGLGLIVDGGYGSTTYDIADASIRRNWFNIPKSMHYNNASTDGYKYSNRQFAEIKRGRRWLFQGNTLTGAFSYQNSSPSFFISGRGVYTSNTGTGISDITIISNTIAHAPTGWECSGNTYASSDGVVPARILFQNNLLYDINGYTYDNSGPGALNRGYFTSLGGCQGVRYVNNTHGQVNSLGPWTFFGGGDDIRGGRLDKVDNIMYYNQGNVGCTAYGVGFDETPNNATYPRLPALSGTTATARYDSFWAKIGAGSTTANHNISNNVMVGGVCAESSSTVNDLSQATVTSVSADFPSGNLWPSGNTKALRETATGFTDASTYNYALLVTSPYYRASANKFNAIGANLPVLTADQGQVQDIAVTAGYTSATARYLAPDTQACTFDVTADSGATWTRATDAGGSPYRVVSVSGLASSTLHTYRVICYYQQLNDGRQWDDWPATKLSTGTFTTGSSSPLILLVSYNLASISGATKGRFTVYMADGTNAVTTCTSSPCSVDFTNNAAQYKMDALSSADAVLSPGELKKAPTQ